MKHDIRTYSELDAPDASDLPGQIRDQAQRVARRLERVRHVAAVMSGKGGVGKSFAAATLAAAAGRADLRVGLLDADLTSPTADRMLGVAGERLAVREDAVVPPAGPGGIRVISTALLLEEDAPLGWKEPDSDAFVWRGAQERGVLREFLSDVRWGELDLLLVDLPPGVGRLEQLAGLVPALSGVLALTIPTAASGSSVRRSLRVARRRELKILGVIENMSGYVCAGCGRDGELFPGEAGSRLASEFDAPLLGRVPFDPMAAGMADRGRVEELLDETTAGRAISEVFGRVWEEMETR